MAFHQILRLSALLLSLAHAVGAIYTTFSVKNSSIFHAKALNRLIVNNRTGSIFVAGVNNLYELNSDLVVLEHVRTGPGLDNPKCVPETKCSARTEMDNYNKILLLHPNTKSLILCGSLFQGSCELRSLSNLSDVTRYQSGLGMFVAANNATASTVAFIAPGPDSEEQAGVGGVGDRRVMYVGVTSTSAIVKLPTISSRDLDTRIFELATKEHRGRKVSLDSSSLLLNRVNIEFVAGFSFADYSYFVTVQEVPKVSRLMQVCHKDPFYRSYVEIPIICSHDGVDYPVVTAVSVMRVSSRLAAALKIQDGVEVMLAAFSDSESKASVLCMYSMEQVRAKLVENVKKCYKGDYTYPGVRISRQMTTCPQPTNREAPVQRPQVYYLCNTGTTGNMKYARVMGQQPLRAVARYHYARVTITAVTAVVVHVHTVIFVGTSAGHLKKIVVGPVSAAREYADITIEQGTPVRAGMTFDLTRQHLYIMTSTKVTKLPVAECSTHLNCHSCLTTKDPFCGWCLLENKCTKREECSSRPRSSNWLTRNANRCIVLVSVTPDRISVYQQKELYLTMNMDNLPDKSSYSCVFAELDWSSPARRRKMGLACDTPNLPQLGRVNNAYYMTGYLPVTLALNSSQTGVLFLQSNIYFYNCSVYTTCKTCTKSNWSCDWCIYDNKCTDDITSCQPGIITGRNSAPLTEDDKKGPNACPHLLDQSTPLTYMASGVNTTVVVRGSTLPEPIMVKGYKCIFNISNNIVVTVATWINRSTVECASTKYSYKSLHGSIVAHVSLSWGGDFMVEDYYNFRVIIYKCNIIGGRECGLCQSAVASDPRYRCQWCRDDCRHVGLCGGQTSRQCPAPFITSVAPLSGPIQGGTNVTIRGRNLGSKVEDMENNIRIAGFPCVVIREEYHVSRRVVCTTTQSLGRETMGRVVINHNGRDVIFNAENKLFRYRNPELTNIFPTRGPKSGGSRVRLRGQDLMTGSVVKVFMESIPCLIDSISLTDNEVDCVTSAVDKPGAREPSMTFDGSPRTLAQPFLYTDDPVITVITPLKTIASGGTTITVIGRYFMSIQHPLMFANNSQGIATYKSECQVIDDTQMTCSAPRLLPKATTPYIVRQKRATQQSLSTLHLGFEMDWVQSVRNLSQYFSALKSQVEYHRDPIVLNFTEKDAVKLYKGEALIIEGEYLNLAADTSSYRIWIGDGLCNVSSLSYNNIVCSPPLTQPPGFDKNGQLSHDILPFVKVMIGNLHFTVGRIKYHHLTAESEFPTDIIAGVAAAGVFLFLVSVVICIVCRRQNTKSERIYRKMQIQLDTLESNVRNECKQAFAELQTDMTDLTSDLLTGGIPFWDYQTYANKILFPQGSENSIIHPPLRNGQIKHTEHGLHMFYKLLTNKDFMLSFIRVLESQSTFTVKDKSYVASLIMVIYQNDLQYATEILKSLLSELVAKSVETKHPKLMLRRTESVVEKLLTNWLSLCLYNYTREYTGSSLFILYKAIKLQMEKGPVDYLTSDARYSLSEDKLLREKIEPKPLLLYVIYENEQYMCRLLDCDTITQVKSKILDTVKKSVPFSQRPAIRDLDLEWRDQRGDIHILSDEDCTTTTIDGWRQINTLGHYYMRDNTCLQLVHKDCDDSVIGTLDSSTSSSSAMMPLVTIKTPDLDKSTKSWHLIKQNEDGTQNKDGTKMISEIFLTRLLATKGTLQKYIDDLLSVILSVNTSLPPVVKYLYDFLDTAAKDNGITDVEVVHTWKSNSLLLRFWVNIIKNPNFVFDIDKPVIVDSCLSVVAQTFMDSCSTAEHSLSKDSPSNKLLFAKDIPSYKKLVEKYFRDIQERPAISDQDLSTCLADVSRMCTNQFNQYSALRELYSYVVQYNKELLIYLEEDAITSKSQLTSRLAQVQLSMDDHHVPLVNV